MLAPGGNDHVVISARPEQPSVQIKWTLLYPTLVVTSSLSVRDYALPEKDNCYYYVPSIAFYGTAENLGVQTGKTYYYSEKPELLFLLNALDGSIIDDVIA